MPMIAEAAFAMLACTRIGALHSVVFGGFASGSLASASALAAHARVLGLSASVVDDPNAALPHCPLVVTCTPANAVVLHAAVRADAFVAAVGSFTPTMRELGAELCRDVGRRGSVWLDTADARHEAGDLLQAGLDLAPMPTLREALTGSRPHGPVLFKSCGWAGWDLAAARTAARSRPLNPDYRR